MIQGNLILIQMQSQLASISTVEHATEEIQLDGLNVQDSGNIDSDFSSLNSSLTHCPMFNTQPSEEDNEGVTSMINVHVEESEVKMSIEETHNGSVMAVEPTECEDTSFVTYSAKTVLFSTFGISRNTILKH